MPVLDPGDPMPDEELFWNETLLALKEVFDVSNDDARAKIREKRARLRAASPLGKAMAYHESPLLTAAALCSVSPEPKHFEKFAAALNKSGSLAIYTP